MAIKWILIIEDEPAIQQSLKMLIESEGYSVKTADNGKQAVEILEGWNKLKEPCLIFCDLMMPVMNGWEFIEYLLEDSVLAVIPVIIISASSTEGVKKRVIKKPFEIEIVMKAVKMHCGEGCKDA